MHCMTGMSPRQIPVYIQMSLANKYPCILVSPVIIVSEDEGVGLLGHPSEGSQAEVGTSSYELGH